MGAVCRRSADRSRGSDAVVLCRSNAADSTFSRHYLVVSMQVIVVLHCIWKLWNSNTINTSTGSLVLRELNVHYMRALCIVHENIDDSIAYAHNLGIQARCGWCCVTFVWRYILLSSSTFRRIAELLLVRDTTLIPNILWFEYTTQRTEARSRQRKQRNKAH